jgi:hypothetical protein
MSCCDFHLLIDVNEWNDNGCAACALPRMNIRDWFTRSHPSKGENRNRNRSSEQAFIRAGSTILFKTRLI